MIDSLGNSSNNLFKAIKSLKNDRCVMLVVKCVIPIAHIPSLKTIPLGIDPTDDWTARVNGFHAGGQAGEKQGPHAQDIYR